MLSRRIRRHPLVYDTAPLREEVVVGEWTEKSARVADERVTGPITSPQARR
jgi:hypothetical protein